MYKGSTGAGGAAGFPPALITQGPPMPGARQSHNQIPRGMQVIIYCEQYACLEYYSFLIYFMIDFFFSACSSARK